MCELKTGGRRCLGQQNRHPLPRGVATMLVRRRWSHASCHTRMCPADPCCRHTLPAPTAVPCRAYGAGPWDGIGLALSVEGAKFEDAPSQFKRRTGAGNTTMSLASQDSI